MYQSHFFENLDISIYTLHKAVIIAIDQAIGSV